jgi:excisionase family DNA binding protein
MSAQERKPLSPDELGRRVVITVQEYAATFGADQRTVRKAIRAGQIRAVQVGDIWRIPVAPLLRQCGLDLEDSEGRQLASRHDFDQAITSPR